MKIMSDRDVIAWARMLGDAWSQLFGDDSKAAYRFRCLADLAEKGAEDWQPIATAPEDSMILLGDRLTLRVFGGCYRNGVTLLVSDGRAEPEPATHWRPLPAPPGGGR